MESTDADSQIPEDQRPKKSMPKSRKRVKDAAVGEHLSKLVGKSITGFHHDEDCTVLHLRHRKVYHIEPEILHKSSNQKDEFSRFNIYLDTDLKEVLEKATKEHLIKILEAATTTKAQQVSYEVRSEGKTQFSTMNQDAPVIELKLEGMENPGYIFARLSYGMFWKDFIEEDTVQFNRPILVREGKAKTRFYQDEATENIDPEADISTNDSVDMTPDYDDGKSSLKRKHLEDGNSGFAYTGKNKHLHRIHQKTKKARENFMESRLAKRDENQDKTTP